jgi:hypothetical protein
MKREVGFLYMCVPKPWPTVGDESHLSFQETFALVGTP